jgi:5-methyltetrahydrofolate--homocysteine methyltransferase
VPAPPFWGARVVERVPVKALVPYLNETMLFQFQWGFRKAGKSIEEWKRWANGELRPILRRMMELCEKDDILQPQACYGYWRCASEGDSVVLFDDAEARREVARFAFPRQAREGGLCIADFFRDRASGETDVIGLQVVTMGQKASDVARAWFAENRYQDYLYLHGMGVELAEALAEYTHKRIRAELGFAGEDAKEMDAMLKQGYRGSRYSFGYPACPNLADQHQLLKLLGAERIGVEMSDEDQLHPEQSTSAIVLLHPQAKYFSV